MDTEAYDFNEDTLSALQELDLTYYGSKAYYALILTGTSKASEVSEVADIPRSKVYSVLKRLKREGWVSVEGKRPLLYRAVPPKDIMEEKKKGLVSKVDDAKRELVSVHEGRVEREVPKIWLVRGSRNVIAKTGEILRRTQDNVSMLGSLYLPGEMEMLEDIAPQLDSRGVEMRIMCREIITRAGEEVRLGEELSRLTPHLKTIDTPLIRFNIVDGKEMMIIFSLAVEDGADIDNVLALWMPGSEVASLMQSNFDMVWDSYGEGG